TLSDGKFVFEVDGLPDRSPRADVARAIVQAGWNLLELKSTTLSLEEVYLQLTGGNTQSSPAVVDGGVA
ncbi:MAG: hypothetical protein JO211_16990, partial [Acidobacteriaceae bacterium]|nr:hypothetical protein [Acidobacteriaceae bacterium]